MTEVMMDISNYGIVFDCVNHSKDHDVCTIISTLCNVLVVACQRFDENFKPEIYEKGHVRLCLNFTDDTIRATFYAVDELMKEVQRQNPRHVKIL